MPKALPALAPIERIIRAAARQQAGPLDGLRCRSLPIPMRGLQGLSILFLYGPEHREGDQDGPWIGPPRYIATFDAETAGTEEIRPVQAAELGLAGGQWLGRGHTPALRADAGFVAHEKALLACYDALLPQLAAGVLTNPDEAARWARQFAASFAAVAEPPLASCYQRLGAWFFDWIQRVKR